jgi:isoleucyl-tRNA synthetase
LGPKYGKNLGKISAFLAQNGNALYNELQNNGIIKLDLGDITAELSADDVLIEVEKLEGYISQSFGPHLVVLETNLTDKLIEEGIIREVISKIQNLRKELGFEITDKIDIKYYTQEELFKIIDKNKHIILDEVLANSISNLELKEFNTVSINGIDLKILLEKSKI